MVKDMHKYKRPLIPVLGGVAILIGLLVSLALSQLIAAADMPLGNLFIFYFVVIVYGMYGMIDDIFHFKKRYSKIATLLVLSLPLVSLVDPKSISFGFLNFIPTNILLIVLIPIYVMVVANLINLHAGFNGLGPGTTLVMLVAAGIKVYLTHGPTNLIFLMPIFGSILIFFLYNKYPAKIFDGNIGAFIMGSALGAFLILNNLEIFGVIILIPHIITFVLDTWVLGIRRFKDIEFPKPRKDGLIIPDKSMRYKSLKNILCTWFKLTEKQAAWILIGTTTIFCFVAVMWV